MSKFWRTKQPTGKPKRKVVHVVWRQYVKIVILLAFVFPRKLQQETQVFDKVVQRNRKWRILLTIPLVLHT